MNISLILIDYNKEDIQSKHIYMYIYIDYNKEDIQSKQGRFVYM